MTTSLALWHGTKANRELLEARFQALAPEIPLAHRVRADLLAAARPAGPTPWTGANPC